MNSRHSIHRDFPASHGIFQIMAAPTPGRNRPKRSNRIFASFPVSSRVRLSGPTNDAGGPATCKAVRLRSDTNLRNLQGFPPLPKFFRHEEDLPTKSSSPEAATRIPSPHAYARGSGDPQESPRQGPEAARRLRNLSYESLRNSRDFRRVLSDGTRRRQGGIAVSAAGGREGPPRVGLVVSKSCGTAVKRNRIKRRLRAAAGAVELQPGIDYVIIANPQVADAPFDRLTGWLSRAVEAVGEGSGSVAGSRHA
jgi:ribonuclease P protein component